MTAAERDVRAEDADGLCLDAFAATGCPEAGVALVAVGGYGRRELAPFSDLDVVLVHDDDIEAGEWAARIWYPLWDSGLAIDHSVRSFAQVLEQSAADVRVALGLLDARHLAGDPNLTLRLRAWVLASWRRDARERLPELHALVTRRAARFGELADVSVPDLKEAAGGIRDATVLKALVATWLVDVPHADLERSRLAILDVRDALHTLTGRATDRVAPECWPELADALGLPDATSAQRHVRGLARRVNHISRLTWQRVEAVQRRPRYGVRRPRLDPVAPGVAVSFEEVVLDRGARASADPLLLLRAAAEAAERGLVLAPPTAARLVREAPALPEPWPDPARQLFVRLLASGRGLLPVWETLDETGALAALLPEWDRVRLLPHATAVHRFTVDRHLVETCIEASRLLSRVARPDILVVAALLHDIGKGTEVEHSRAGEPIAGAIARRIGFDGPDAALIARLVRRHLLLPGTAPTRDPEDPATIDHVTVHVGDREELELLAALTEADALATSDQAWTTWRARLVHDLVRRAAAALDQAPPPTVPEREVDIPAALLTGSSQVYVEVCAGAGGDLVRVIGEDRTGLLADAAAMLALQRVQVRSARVWTQTVRGRSFGVSEWAVDRVDLDVAVLRQRLARIVSGGLDAAARLRRSRPSESAPSVVVLPEASARATVLEVRAADRPGLVHAVCAALAGSRIAVASAHVATVGPRAVDVFYLHDEAGTALTEERAAEVTRAVRAALG